MKMPQPFTHFPWFICMWGAISHNAVRAQPPSSCCILNLVKSCRSKSKFRRRVQMQLIAQNRIYFDVLLQILVIDSKLKGTYTLLMGFFPSCTDFWKIVYYWLFSRLYPCARYRDCAVCTISEPIEVLGVHSSLTPKNPSLELGLHFNVWRQLCVTQF